MAALERLRTPALDKTTQWHSSSCLLCSVMAYAVLPPVQALLHWFKGTSKPCSNAVTSTVKEGSPVSCPTPWPKWLCLSSASFHSKTFQSALSSSTLLALLVQITKSLSLSPVFPSYLISSPCSALHSNTNSKPQVPKAFISLQTMTLLSWFPFPTVAIIPLWPLLRPNCKG